MLVSSWPEFPENIVAAGFWILGNLFFLPRKGFSLLGFWCFCLAMFISAWAKLFVICHCFWSIIVGFTESPTFLNSNVLHVMVGSFCFLTVAD